MSSDYDVFLSFSSRDIEIARSIWEEFIKNGVRAFISDETLKKRIGQSFITAIHDALENSDNFVLLATPSSLASAWVREEYETFYAQKYIPSNRNNRLFILKGPGVEVVTLLLMLRNIQVSESVDSILDTIGRFDVAELRKENIRLQEETEKLKFENHRLHDLLEKSSSPGKEETKKGDSYDDLGKGTEEVDKPSIFIDTSNRAKLTQQELDFLVNMTVSKNEAASGFSTTIELPKNITCDSCNGKGYRGNTGVCKTCSGNGQVRRQEGFFSIQQTCPDCRGTGKALNCPMCDGSGTINSNRKVKLTVPPIQGDKLKMRVKGEGVSSESGDEKGDVFVLIFVERNT